MQLILNKNIKKTAQCIGLVVMLFCVFNSGAMAAKDGFLEEKSTGEIFISLTIPDALRFSIEVDFDKEYTSPSGDVVREADACINFSGGSSYSIMVTTDNDGFKLNRATDGDEVGFQAYWSASSGRENGMPLSYGKSLSGLVIDEKQTADCINGKRKGNSNFSIVIPKNGAIKTKSGSYSATISVVITPE